MFSLPALLELAGNTAQVTVTLSPESVQLLLSALGYAENTQNWTGSDEILTDVEIDQIQALVARTTDELLMGGEYA